MKSKELNVRVALEVMEHNPEVVPDYSTDCKAAWDVVENLHKRGYYFSLAYGRGEPRVSVMFFREIFLVKTSPMPVTAVATTMAQAVCYAALRAVERERKYELRD